MSDLIPPGSPHPGAQELLGGSSPRIPIFAQVDPGNPIFGIATDCGVDDLRLAIIYDALALHKVYAWRIISYLNSSATPIVLRRLRSAIQLLMYAPHTKVPIFLGDHNVMGGYQS
ncbi:hypothetical protein BS47DRAFT_1456891 [Hydnum rufescens UP504]|uniref:Uncharacterized protein n=1 Tax=Hydnum rufescens UP504 TaxID=1448309 RepID=A0A9P6DSV8_9AGAM|nr:hypothetical protein BS47DRAFT_1456891 [Hydnum rufescens UP504]